MVWRFIFADLTKSFHLVPKLTWSSQRPYHTISGTWNTWRNVLLPPSQPSPCYWYHIRKTLYARGVHNRFAEGVSCETYWQTMNNFKLRKKYVFAKQCSFKIAVPEADWLRCCIFIEFTLCHGCSPLNLWQ